MTAEWEGVSGMGKESAAPGARYSWGHGTQAEEDKATNPRDPRLLRPDHTTRKGVWRKKQNTQTKTPQHTEVG